MITLDTVASFISSFGQNFFLKTINGNFVWSNPDYGGDNTIVPFKGTYKSWCKNEGIPFGRDKGQHTIRGYCGEDVKIRD